MKNSWNYIYFFERGHKIQDNHFEIGNIGQYIQNIGYKAGDVSSELKKINKNKALGTDNLSMKPLDDKNTH